MSVPRPGVAIGACAGLVVLAAVTRVCLAADGGASTAADPPPYISWTWSAIVAKPGEPRGYVAFQRDCSVCHGTGPTKPGTRALRTKYHGKLPALLEQRTDLQPDYIKYIVRHGVSVMPPFRKTELNDVDLAAIVAYLTRKHGR
jgi:(+)-pinoresinol hydroxylase